ncbi:MAG: DUF1080 domain-containing protein [Bryobacterales bacterium]|nr:DUF1080 domain-containing protein [Bryobacterales bacterium]MDE0262683.1 DUF1080 domain-containing protein [Bryobacterales bacterium]
MNSMLDTLNRRGFLAAVAAGMALPASDAAEDGFEPLFNGKDLAGWEGDPFLWKVEDGMVVGRSPGIAYNDFLTTTDEYSDFVLRFQIQLVDNIGNSGVQIRSRRVSGSMEMIGYQVDIGPSWWGSLYDESRRRVTLAAPSEATIKKALKPTDWNDYEVQASGKHIVLKLNGVVTVDYTEEDESIEQTGLIGLQVHSGPPLEARFRNIRVKRL